MLVFNAAGTGDFDLYLFRLDKFGLSRIAGTAEHETAPSFTPDGDSVLYAAGVPGDRADHIFTCALNGTSVTQLTRADANDSSPRVSPDGSLVVFDRDTTYRWGGLAANWDRGGVICVVGIDGTNERQLTPEATIAWEPWFMPDGKTVAYSTPAGVFAVPVDKSSPPRLLADLNGPGEVVSSNDGKMLAYTRGRYSGSQELLIANADGTAERRITAKLDAYYRPRFTPNGDRVFFCKEEWPDGPTGSPRFSLWRVDVDGKNLQKVASSRLFDEPLKWRPEATTD